ncbi:hypothetical protein COLO4_01898 [Corchorus olitorius]|uniref:Uncharacterized protein n=1 Tax=Corchorus olitorius TaxID=93759 RepID=A0A1R3L1U4_9ROSI|nr:hypothetical protein COLO4_01898 [Corchorus olitorius]
MDLAYGMRGQDTKIQGILATFDNFQRRENRHSTAAQMLGSRVFPLLREYDSLHNGYLDHLKSQSPDTPYGFLSRMRGIEAEVKEVVESMNDQPLASLTEEEAVVVNGTLALLGEMFIPTEGTFLFNYGHIPLYADGKGFMTLVEVGVPTTHPLPQPNMNAVAEMTDPKTIEYVQPAVTTPEEEKRYVTKRDGTRELLMPIKLVKWNNWMESLIGKGLVPWTRGVKEVLDEAYDGISTNELQDGLIHARQDGPQGLDASPAVLPG